MKRMVAILAMAAASMLPMPAAAQAAATTAPAGGAADGCERVKAHMEEMAGHMKRMAEGRGGHCGLQGRAGKGPGDGRGHCMRRMGEMMKELAQIADHCHAMTPSHARHMARHEQHMARWKEEGAAKK